MGCCGTTIKYLLIIFNIIFVLCGIALIVVGSLLLADVDEFSDIADNINSDLKAPQITLIVVGSVTFVISFLGCCGAIRKSKCMLITFGICLLVLFVIQLAIGIYAIVEFNNDTLTKTLYDIFNSGSDDSRAMFDSLQSSLECCGVNGDTDYGNGSLVPQSCCDQDGCKNNTHWPVGCASALKDWILQAGKYLGGVAIGLSVIEVIGMIFAFYQASRTKDYFS